MTQSKGQKQRQWDIRKESQNEHGKVKSFKELEQEGTQKSSNAKRNPLNGFLFFWFTAEAMNHLCRMPPQ